MQSPPIRDAPVLDAEQDSKALFFPTFCSLIFGRFEDLTQEKSEPDIMRQAPFTLAEIGMISGTRFVIATGVGLLLARQNGSQDAPGGQHPFASSWNSVFPSDGIVVAEQAANCSRAEPANPGRSHCLIS